MKIRLKLTLFYTSIILILIILFALIFHRVLINSLEKISYNKFNNFLKIIISQYKLEEIQDLEELKIINFKILRSGNNENNFTNNMWLAFFDENRKLINSTVLAQQYPIDTNIVDITKKNNTYKFENEKQHPVFISNKKNEVYTLIKSYKMENKKLTYYIVICIPATVEVETFNKIRNMFLYGFLVLFFIVFIFGILFTAYTLQPIKRITKSLNKISKDDLSKRLEVKNPKDEIGILTCSINELFERLEHSFNMEKQFISDISHEFKTPLSVLRLTLENAVNNPKLCDEDLDKLGNVLETIYSMDFLVKKLLYLSKLEQNLLPFHPEKININKTVNKAFENLRTLAEAKNLEYKINFDKEKMEINGDEELLYIAIYNMIENALKYTENGYIAVWVKKENDRTLIIIEDSGIGIPDDKLNNIFEKFYRVNPARNDKKGYGIGLSISKRIIDLHNGKIKVESIPGKKTIFTIEMKQGGGLSVH